MNLIENGKFIDKVDQSYTVDLLRQYLNERKIDANGYKDKLINFVLMYLLSKKLNTSFAKEKEIYDDERLIEKYLKNNSIEFNECESGDTKYRKYLEVKFGPNSNLVK